MPDDDSYKVVASVCYKNIIEMKIMPTANKYTIGSSNTIEIRYAKTPEYFQKYIIAKWNGLAQGNPYAVEGQEYLDSIYVKVAGSEQNAIDFQHDYVENKRQIYIGEQLSKMSAFIEEKCQAEIDFIEVNFKSQRSEK